MSQFDFSVSGGVFRENGKRFEMPVGQGGGTAMSALFAVIWI
jgi:hypothetical protein